METIDNARVKAVVHWYCVNTGCMQYEVAKLLGYNNKVNFSQMMNGYKRIPEKLPAKICALDSRINLDYMLGKSDEMVVSPMLASSDMSSEPQQPSVAPAPPVAPPAPQTKKGIVVPPELATMFADMAATIKGQQELISSLINSNK